MNVIQANLLDLPDLGFTTSVTIGSVAVVVALVLGVLVVAGTGLTFSAVRVSRVSGRSNEQLVASFRRMSIVIAVSSLATLVVAGFAVARQTRSAQYYQTMRLLTESQRSTVAESHVWLEEVLEGDQFVNPEAEVIAPVARALELCHAARSGGRTPFGIVPEAPEALRADLERLCDRLSHLGVLTRRRLQNSSSAGAGTTADQIYDMAYAQVVASLEALQADLREFTSGVSRSSVWTEAALLGLVLLLAAAAMYLSMSARGAMLASLLDLRRLAAVVESSSDAVYSLSPAGTILSWNRGAELIYGYSAADAIGTSVLELAPAEEQPQVRRALARLLAGERITGEEGVGVDRLGGIRHMSISAAPIRDVTGRITSISVVAREVTLQKLAEVRLRASHDRYRLVGRATNDLVWERDPAGTLIWAERLHETFGYAEEQVRPDIAWWMEHVHPDDRARLTEMVAIAQSRLGEPWSLEYRFRRADGSYAVVLDRGYFQHDPTGEAVRAVGALTDISARKQAEVELRNAKEEAERANQAKGDFLSRMSHELRTPLNSMLGFAQVLRFKRAATLTDLDLTYVDRILANGQHLLGLIDEVLDLSRIEAGKMVVTLEAVSLRALIGGVIEQLEGSTAGKPVRLEAELPETIAPVFTDGSRLAQILVNIVGNAVKFTDRGSVRVRVVVDPATARPLRIVIADTGVGIPTDRIACIFQPFEQAEKGWARRFGGTGLGLSISQSLAELLDISLHVDSELGVGSTFTIELDRLAYAGEPAGSFAVLAG